MADNIKCGKDEIFSFLYKNPTNLLILPYLE